MSQALLVSLLLAHAAPPLDDLRRTVTKTRGLPMPPDLVVEVHTPAQVRAAAIEQARRPRALDSLRCGQATLEALGLVDASFNLGGLMETIQQAAVAGYYDAEQSKLVLVRRGASFSVDDLPMGDRMTAVHELVHAAQDGAFDLHALRDRDQPTGDVDLALRGLVEGDATWWMLPLSAGVSADMLRFLPGEQLEMMGLGATPSAADLGLPDDLYVPDLLITEIVSPYLDGMRFVHALQRAGGTVAVDAAFRDPPLSTEQLLHPERYLERDPPVLIDLSAVPDPGPGWARICDTGLGERLLIALLGDLGPGTAREAAAGWDGDRMRVWRDDDGQTALAWRLVFDTDDDAAEAARALQAWSPPRPAPTEVTRQGRQVVVLRATGVMRRTPRIRRLLLRAPAAPMRDLDVVAPRWPPDTTPGP